MSTAASNDHPDGGGKQSTTKKATKRASKSEESGQKKKVKKESTSKISSPDDNHSVTSTSTVLSQHMNGSMSSNGANLGTTHRPVTSCTHCRQHKIKCDASQNFPAPCTRCAKNGFHCEINPQFRPKKGSMMQMLAHEVDELKYKVSYLIRNDGLIAKALANHKEGQDILRVLNTNPPGYYQEGKSEINTNSPSVNHALTPNHETNSNSSPNTKISVQTYLAGDHPLVSQDTKSPTASGNAVPTQAMNMNRNDIIGTKYTTSVNKPILPPILNDSTPTNNSSKAQINSGLLQMAFHRNSSTTGSPSTSRPLSPLVPNGATSHGMINNDIGLQQAGQVGAKKSPIIATTTTMDPLPSPQANIDEFVLGDIRLSINKADELHSTFLTKYLPYFPIMSSNSATELFGQSQLLFWTVMLTASMSEPEPTLYMKLSTLIKQLAIETCWIRTPRSTHISQALLILCNWPLPNQKVLDDCSYRFVGLAKSLSYQLGLHRGEFIYEFTRTQTSMPDAEKWRTRTWLGIFFSENCWSSILGLPPNSKPDYLTEKAKKAEIYEDNVDKTSEITSKESNKGKAKETNGNANEISDNKMTLPKRFKQMLILADFQGKLCNIMGTSVTSPDGLMEPSYRSDALSVLDKELEELNTTYKFDTDDVVNIYYLYIRLMIYCFAFLPGTPAQDQLVYVNPAYTAATKIVTLLTQLLKDQQLIELPIYIRQSASYASLILFKLQLSPALSDKCFESARQSIVTIHRCYRNQLSAWATVVENDISRTASMLEKLNFVLITHPEVLVEEAGIISRMRSHMTGSLFYDLVWCVHEARRREVDPEYNRQVLEDVKKSHEKDGSKQSYHIPASKLYPLPLYNQISKEDFKTVTKTTPNGTTVTTLVPTRSALRQAESNSNNDGGAVAINGIPLAMLDENGSLDMDNLFSLQNIAPVNGEGAIYPRMIDSIIRPEDIPDRPNSAMAAIAPSDRQDFGNKGDVNSSTQQGVNPPNDFMMERQASFPPTQNPRTTGSSLASLPEIPKNGKSFKDFANIAQWGNFASNPTSGPNKNNKNDIPSANSRLQLNQLSDFFQQQSAGWIEGNLGNDDFFGWLDMNMEPKF